MAMIIHVLQTKVWKINVLRINLKPTLHMILPKRKQELQVQQEKYVRKITVVHP